MSVSLHVAPSQLRTYPLRAPLAVPRTNAFGTMHERPALLVELVDGAGAAGWGETFCNWPPFAAEYRRRLIVEVLRPLVMDREFESPAALRAHLERETRALRLQCGDRGAFDQGIAGIETAAWRAIATRTGTPLQALLADAFAAGPGPAPGDAPTDDPPGTPVYASALTAATIEALVPPLVETGWHGFKLKVGFDADEDERAVARLRALVGDGATIMLDANQRLDRAEAVRACERLAPYRIDWLEEPLPADAPLEEWRGLSDAVDVPLALGENLAGRDAFRAVIDGGAIEVLQPDPIKWGGLSGALEVAADARRADGRERPVRLCPHYLGGGIGLHLTAALAGAVRAPWLEVDVTENPLRTELAPALPIVDGRVDVASHGSVEPDGDALFRYGLGR